MKDTDTQIQRAGTTEYIHRWLATSIETATRRIRRGKNQTEDSRRSDGAHREHGGQ